MKTEHLVNEVVELLPQLVKRLHASYSEYADSRGLTLGQMKALSYLFQNGRSTVGEVADGLGLAMPTASELVDKLAERDLVEREINPQNRRQVLVGLTESAQCYGQEIYAMRRAQIAHAFVSLEPDEQASFVRGLRELLDAVGTISHSQCLTPSATAPPLGASPNSS